MRHKTSAVSIDKPNESSLELTEDIIRARAYHFYEERGCEDGHALEDWLRAEAEIVGKQPAAAEGKDKGTEARVMLAGA